MLVNKVNKSRSAPLTFRQLKQKPYEVLRHLATERKYDGANQKLNIQRLSSFSAAQRNNAYLNIAEIKIIGNKVSITYNKKSSVISYGTLVYKQDFLGLLKTIKEVIDNATERFSKEYR